MEKAKEIFNYCLEDRFEIEDDEQRRIYIIMVTTTKTIF